MKPCLYMKNYKNYKNYIIKIIVLILFKTSKIKTDIFAALYRKYNN